MQALIKMKICSFLKNSLIDYPGHIASVVFTNGCNWNCWYCQNKGILNSEVDKTDELFNFLRERVGFIDGVVVCGGEPTIHPDLPEFISKIKDLGFDVKLDTNGTNPNLLQHLIDKKLIDYVAMDLKNTAKNLAKTVCSTNDLNKIDKSIEILLSGKVNYEFRTTVVPELTNDDIVEIAQKITGASIYILQQYRKPDFLTSAPEPKTIETLQEMCTSANKYVKTIIR